MVQCCSNVQAMNVQMPVPSLAHKPAIRPFSSRQTGLSQPRRHPSFTTSKSRPSLALRRCQCQSSTDDLADRPHLQLATAKLPK